MTLQQLMNSHKYDDIIGLPHPVSAKHPQMAREDRAAQFSPFAALTGYGAVEREDCFSCNTDCGASGCEDYLL